MARVIDHLEPVVAGDTWTSLDVAVKVSIAISLKRIADALEKQVLIAEEQLIVTQRQVGML